MMSQLGVLRAFLSYDIFYLWWVYPGLHFILSEEDLYFLVAIFCSFFFFFSAGFLFHIVSRVFTFVGHFLFLAQTISEQHLSLSVASHWLSLNHLRSSWFWGMMNDFRWK